MDESTLTRQQRRAFRLQRLVGAKEAHRAALLPRCLSAAAVPFLVAIRWGSCACSKVRGLAKLSSLGYVRSRCLTGRAFLSFSRDNRRRFLERCRAE